MPKENARGRTRFLVQLAVLTAILLLLEATNLGFIRLTPLIEFTVMQIPVVIGAIALGPPAGAILGGIFGLLSFWECFGKSAFGAILLGINPFAAFLVCFVPRLLMGWLCGLLYRGFQRLDTRGMWSFFAASAAGAVLNTLFFMGFLMSLFGRSDYILGMRGGMSVLAFVAAFVGIQGLVEAGVCCAVGGFVSRALHKAAQ